MQRIELDNHIIEYEVSYRGKKYIRARVANRHLVVTAPPRTQPIYIEQILRQNSRKIINMLFPKPPKEKREKVKPVEPIKEKEPDYVHLLDKEYFLSYVVGDENQCYVNHNDIILVAKKDDKVLFRRALYTYYKEIVEEEIKRLLPKVREDFAEITLPVINVKDYKSTRLGVCRFIEGKYVISLSAKLAKYDLKYVKVVLYHELSHIFEMNHSAKFYDVFERKYPNAKQAQKALKAIKYRDCI